MVDSQKTHLLHIDCSKLSNAVNKTILATIFLLFSNLSFGATVIIVHPDNDNELTSSVIRKIFLGQTYTFPNGDKATPIDQKGDSSNKNTFIKKVLRKSPSSLNSYWSRMMFSSKGLPPKTLAEQDAKAEVAKNPQAISYIDADNIDESIKVVLTIE